MLAGNTTPLKFGPSTSALLQRIHLANTTWFNAKIQSATTADVKLAGAWAPAGTTPNFTPMSSPLLTGGSFTNPKLATWFTQVAAYKVR